MNMYCTVAGLILSAYATVVFAVSQDNAGGHDRDNDRNAVVIDSHGREIGELITFAAQDGVVVSAGGKRAVVPIRRQTTTGSRSMPHSASLFLWDSFTNLFYASIDCSGAPFVTESPAFLGPWPAVSERRGSNVTVYFADNAAMQPVEIKSVRDEETQICSPITSPVTLMGWNAKEKVVLTTRYTEPLTIRF